MVKRQSPRILAATALSALVIGLSACGGTPQTLMPYTPAQGVNGEAPRIGAPPDSNEVPLKIRNLVIVADPDTDTGFLSAALHAPTTRDDALTGVEGQTFDAENRPADPIEPITTDVELPASDLVLLTEIAPPLVIGAPALRPGLVAELRLTFAGSEPQTLLVPIVDANDPVYRTVEPGPAPETATATPTAPAPAGPTPTDDATPPVPQPVDPDATPDPDDDAEAEPAPAVNEGTPGPEPTPAAGR